MNRKTILVFLIIAVLALLLSASAIAEDTTDPVLERGNAALEAESYEEALAKLNPNHWDYLYERAMANYNMKPVELETATIDGHEIQYIGEAAYILEYIEDLKDGLEYWTMTLPSELCTPKFIFVSRKEESATIFEVEWEIEDDGDTEDDDSVRHEILISGKYAYFLKDGQATIAGYLGGMWGWDWPWNNVKDATFVGTINNLENLGDLPVWRRNDEEKEPAEDENIHVLMIPDHLNGYPVVAIGNGAFVEIMDRGIVIIPESVVSIGDGAFYASYYFHTLVIPDSVTTIGEDAFEGCGQGLHYDSIGTDEYEFALSVKAGSYAEQYAKDNDIPYTIAK